MITNQNTAHVVGTAPIRHNTVGRATDAAASVTGKRFCAHHQGEAPVADGGYVTRGKSKRWICNACQAKGRKP